MADVAQLGVQVTSNGVNEATAGLTKLSGAAARAQADTENLSHASLGAIGASSAAAKAYADVGSAAASSSKQVEMMNRAANQNNAALNATIAPSKNVAYQARMMALQLSQVAQQTQAGGDFIRALAIQLPDLATGFGAVGIAIGVVGGIALQYFGTLIGSGEDSAKVLKEQQQLIEATAQAWDEAVPALQQYVDQLQRAADLKNLDESLKVLSQQTIANVKSSVDDLRGSFANLTQDLRQAGEEDQVIINLEKAFNDFVKAAQEGKDVTSQVKAVNDALSAAINSTGLPALSEWATSFNGVATAAANAAGKVEQLSNSALTAKLFGGDKLNPLNPLSIYDGKVVSNDNNPPGTVVTDDGRYVPTPTPSDRPSPYGFAEPKTNTAGLKRNADAYRDLIKNAHDRIDQMKLEAQTAGETGIAAETLSFKLKLLQDATDKGRTVTAAQRAEIEKLADAYKEAATAAATAKLQADLAFQQRQMGRSTLDQTVGSTLQQYGLPDDLNSYEASLIRANEQMKTARELAGDFVSTLTSGLRNGEGLWKSFGNAALSVLNKITDTLLNDVLNALFKVGSAGSSGGGLFSSLLGLGGGAFPPAPTPSIGLYANGTNSAPGGLAWVGERGPELVNLPRGAQVVPNHRLTASNQNDASGSASGVHVTVGVTVDQNGNLKAYVKNVAQSEAKDAVGQYDSQVLPSRVNQINKDPRAR
ncbi:hypothetical protein PH552_12355 [Rhizobium sp. CNPSo 3968]|uniref:hypothetical protein n=1 Tax=Rhizobium sp. CNPSo 3968 TaxID=3021408 RepID=UPI0025502090|nr:hypothetical protein [Rhizobium sp. CNPSo 3968]MDK4720136.1 hypothetical protein [Rhizobium sp. CNPSo 3968]